MTIDHKLTTYIPTGGWAVQTRPIDDLCDLCDILVCFISPILICVCGRGRQGSMAGGLTIRGFLNQTKDIVPEIT